MLPVDEFKGHIHLEYAHKGEVSKMKKTLTSKLAAFQHPQTQASLLVGVAFSCVSYVGFMEGGCGFIVASGSCLVFLQEEANGGATPSKRSQPKPHRQTVSGVGWGGVGWGGEGRGGEWGIHISIHPISV